MVIPFQRENIWCSNVQELEVTMTDMTDKSRHIYTAHDTLVRLSVDRGSARRFGDARTLRKSGEKLFTFMIV